MSHSNSIDSDIAMRFAQSDLGVHCLSMSLLWNT